MPVRYNCARFIRPAIESVLQQGYPALEILVTDNASTDNTQAVVSTVRDSRIRYLRNPVNLGFAGNLQRALSLAQHEFLLFLCADDYLYPAYLKKTAARLEAHTETAYIHTGHHLVDEGGRVVKQRIYPWPASLEGAAFLRQLARQGMLGVCLSSVLFRRGWLVRSGGIHRSLESVADYGMWIKLASEGTVEYVPEALVAYRLHAGQTTGLFMPGLKLQLSELFLQETRSRGIDCLGFEKVLLKTAVLSSLRELPRCRIEGASRSFVLKRAGSLWARYFSLLNLLPGLLYLLVSLLPVALLRARWSRS